MPPDPVLLRALQRRQAVYEYQQLSQRLCAARARLASGDTPLWHAYGQVLSGLALIILHLRDDTPPPHGAHDAP